MATKNYKVKILIIIAILTAIFLAISIAVATGKATTTDIELLKIIYSARSIILTQFMTAISAISSTPFTGALTAFAILFFWTKKQRQTAIFFGATMAISAIINNAIKYLIQRHRPDILPLEHASFFSFPSGHAMNSLVFYGLLLYLAHKSIKNKIVLITLDIVAITFVALVGFSRVYLGAHYPTDVIAGFCASGIILGIAYIFLFPCRQPQSFFAPTISDRDHK